MRRTRDAACASPAPRLSWPARLASRPFLHRPTMPAASRRATARWCQLARERVRRLSASTTRTGTTPSSTRRTPATSAGSISWMAPATSSAPASLLTRGTPPSSGRPASRLARPERSRPAPAHHPHAPAQVTSRTAGREPGSGPLAGASSCGVHAPEHVRLPPSGAGAVVGEVAVGPEPDTLQLTPDAKTLVVALRGTPVTSCWSIPAT